MAIQDRPKANTYDEIQEGDLGFLVMRPMSWENFTQWTEIGERVPIHVDFGALSTPTSWLPVFPDIEDARTWADGGLWPILLLTYQRGGVSMPSTTPGPCANCGVIHWAVCPFDASGRLKSKEERDADNERASSDPDGDASTDHN